MSAVLTAPQTAPPRPAATPPGPWRWSRVEYRRLFELGFFQGKRVELIRGEIFPMSAMGTPHTVGVRTTQDALEAAFGPGFHARAQAPLAILDSEPEPDVAVVLGVPRDYLADHPTTALLVVEVADSTLQNDLTTKAELYAEAGVPEYWVVDLTNRALHVLRDPRPLAPGGHAYQAVTVHPAADAVAPLAAGGAVVRVADLLP